MKTGIYARQSIEKQDSVSIEAQSEKCELLCKLNNWEFSSYSDVGYSGSNINRPDFERLLRDIQQGKINRVIAYRLDRISRSISDFANLLTLFEKHNVQFLSATENFDTSSPIGRAMVYIVMVFAQLERETIAQRITDNYYFRAKEGFFTGGNFPFGYRSIKVDNGGKKASILEVDPEASQIVKSIFEKFVEGFSLHRITKELNAQNIKSPKDSSWSSSKVRRILKNAAYVPNTIEVYEYFSRLGCKISNIPQEFNGQSGLCLYGKEKGKKNRKIADVTEQILTIGKFTPILDANTWLQAQYKIDSNTRPPRTGTSKTTWLSGLVSCAVCGYSMALKYTKKKGKEYKYIQCRGRNDRGICSNSKFCDCDIMENRIKLELIKKVTSKEFVAMISSLKYQQNSEFVAKRNTILSKVHALDAEIKNFLSNIGKGNLVIDSYITGQITELDSEKVSLLKEINELDVQIYHESNGMLNAEYLEDIAAKVIKFDNEDVETKHTLASALIRKVWITDPYNAKIEWYV